MNVQRAGKFIMLFLFVSISLSGCSFFTSYDIDEVDYKSNQMSAGILVGDPQVYSRASLINDRRKETTYLQKLLTNSEVDVSGKSVVNFTPQIIRDLKTVNVLSASFGLSLGKEISNQSTATDIQQQIEVTKLQEQLAVLEKQVEGIKNASVPNVTIPSPDLTLSNGSTVSQSNQSTTVWPDLSALQSAIKNIQTQLASMPSVGAPSAPSNNYAMLADPRDDFSDRQAYRRDIRAALSEAQLDDVHDKGGNALYRLAFQVTVLPPNNNIKQWAAAKLVIEAPTLSGKDIKTQYFNWLAYISTMLDDQTDNHDYDYDQFIFKIARQGYFDVVDIYSNTTEYTQHYYCLSRNTALNAQLINIAKNHDVGNDFKKEWTYAVPKSIFKTDESDSKCGKYPPEGKKITFVGAHEIDDQIPIVRAMISNINPQNPSKTFITFFKEPLGKATYRADISVFCKAIVSDPDNKCEKLEDVSTFNATGGKADDANYTVRSYSVLPVELAQRLGVTTEASESLQTALSVAAMTSSTAKSGLDAGFLSQSNARSEALSRQPLVVGFAGSEPTTPPNVGQGFFGWLFGPKFVAKDSKSLSLKHTVRSYGVNSDISVPGWWSYITLNISTAWIKNWTSPKVLETPSDGTNYSNEVKHVNLPVSSASYESLTNFIGAKVSSGQNSQLFAKYVTPNVVPTCASSVTFQIGGANIWRADSILLGGVPAKNIIILPDMKGILAEFDMAVVYGSLTNTDSTVQTIPLMVSAEQGSAAPLTVYVVGKRQSFNGATTCQSPFVLPTELSLLPATVVSSSPAGICKDANLVPVIIQGLNLPDDFTIVSEHFITPQSDEIFPIDGTRIMAILKPVKPDLMKLGTVAPIVIKSKKNGDKKSVALNIPINDCSVPIKSIDQGAAKKNAALVTGTVKIAKDQKITVKIAVPVGYYQIIIAVRPQTKSNDAAWKESSLLTASPGDFSEVTASFDLSDFPAKPGDKLDVVVRIKGSPALDWQQISADNPLLVS